MKLELFYYNECGFSQSVLNTMTNLNIHDRVIKKNIRENKEFELELKTMCGNTQVPTLVIDGSPMRESEDIKKFLISKFL